MRSVGVIDFIRSSQSTAPKAGFVSCLDRRVPATPAVSNPTAIVVGLATTLHVVPPPVGVRIPFVVGIRTRRKTGPGWVAQTVQFQATCSRAFVAINYVRFGRVLGGGVVTPFWHHEGSFQMSDTGFSAPSPYIYKPILVIGVRDPLIAILPSKLGILVSAIRTVLVEGCQTTSVSTLLFAKLTSFIPTLYIWRMVQRQLTLLQEPTLGESRLAIRWRRILDTMLAFFDVFFCS